MPAQSQKSKYIYYESYYAVVIEPSYKFMTPEFFLHHRSIPNHESQVAQVCFANSDNAGVFLADPLPLIEFCRRAVNIFFIAVLILYRIVIVTLEIKMVVCIAVRWH
jgi:hypothetical protein